MRRYYVVAALGIIVVAVVAVAVAISMSDDGTPARTGSADDQTTSTTFPYDFTEAPDEDVDVEMLQGAKFASLTLTTADGLKSYLLASGSPGFMSLTEALREADESRREATPDDAGVGDAVGDETAGGGTASTLTYVMDDRTTYTLVIDLENAVVYRGEQQWQPKTDLAALLQATVAANMP